MSNNAGAPTPPMIAYVKTISGAYGLEKPNLRSFIETKDFLDFDAPQQIIKIRGVMRDYAANMLRMLESDKIPDSPELIWVDSPELRASTLEQVMGMHSVKLSNVMKDKLMKKDIPDLRQYREGLFADAGDAIVKKYLENNKKAEQAGPDSGNKGNANEVSSGATSAIKQEGEVPLKKRSLPENYFAQKGGQDPMKQNSGRGPENQPISIRKIIASGYASLFKMLPSVHIEGNPAKDLLVDVEDKFAQFKNRVNQRADGLEVAEKADAFHKKLSGGVTSGLIKESDCRAFNKILKSNRKKLDGEKDSDWKSLIREIFDRLVKAITAIINKFMLARTAAFSKE